MVRSIPQIDAPETRRLTLVQLEQAIHAAEPAALLVPSRILRRVIKHAAGISGLGLRVPHRKTYILSRQDLLSIVEPDELDLVGQVVLAETVILLSRPSPQTIVTQSAEALLTKYWRLLFHA
ncbi:MAG TPA: hypothetical protein VG433_09520, partial [Pirellulales bacterium]|nr:hypothetical protein [Pirellulales bacterium]